MNRTGPRPKISTEKGADDEKAWSDRHLQHVWLWLTTNPNSPYKGSPTMILTAMGIDRAYWSGFKRSFGSGDFHWYRFSVRLRITAALQKILSGIIMPVVKKRDKRGYVLDFELQTIDVPHPLQCPPFYQGSIRITTRGLQVSLKRTDPVMAPRHDPESRNRLLNPFGRV
jgi:hypothetical protein